MTIEAGHAPNRQYVDRAGNIHLNGAELLDAAEVPYPQQVAISNAAGGSNVALVSFQFEDGAGNALAAATAFDLWLSDAANGIGLTSTTPSGTVAAGASGTVLGTPTVKKSVRGVTDATGLFILAITDSGKTGFYPACSIPGTGKIFVGAQLTSASYG